MNDAVNHPSHYCTGKFKYLYRHGRKNGLEDIKKAIWYLNKYVELEEGNEGKVDIQR